MTQSDPRVRLQLTRSFLAYSSFKVFSKLPLSTSGFSGSGEYRWFEVRWAARRDERGMLADLHTTAHDVTERLVAEQPLATNAEELRVLPLRDHLTGLYNRRGFLELAGLAYAQALANARAGALIFVDLNGMKQINDQQGHEVGDLAIVDAANVLADTRQRRCDRTPGRRRVRGTGARFRPDDLERCDGASAQADEVVCKQERSYRLSMSVGAAWVDHTAPVALDELLEQADQAMYQQKNARRSAGGGQTRHRGTMGSDGHAHERYLSSVSSFALTA